MHPVISDPNFSVAWPLYLTWLFWLKITETNSLTVLARNPKPRCPQGPALPEDSREEPSCVFQRCRLSAVLDSRPCHSCLWLCGHGASSSICLLTSVSLTRTVPYNPEWSPHPQVVNLIILAKTLFPNKDHILDSGDYNSATLDRLLWLRNQKHLPFPFYDILL